MAKMATKYPAGNPIGYLVDDEQDEDSGVVGEGRSSSKSLGDDLYDVAASSFRRSLKFGVSLSFYLPYIIGFFLLLSIVHLHVATPRASKSRHDRTRRKRKSRS
jgi:hypothetical protein